MSSSDGFTFVKSVIVNCVVILEKEIDREFKSSSCRIICRVWRA